MNLLISGGTVVTLGEKGTIEDGAIAVEDEEIIDIGKEKDLKPKYSGYEKIDAKGKVVIPGLINTHQHAAMSLLRGYADDYPLKEWLEKWIWPLERHMTGYDMHIGALLTAVESIMSGTTTVNTMYFYHKEFNEARAFAEAKIRGIIGHGCLSWHKENDKRDLEELARLWHGKMDGTIRVSVDPHAPYTVDPQYLVEIKQWTSELNEKYGSPEHPIIWHMHVAETSDEARKIEEAFNIPVKGGVVEYLDSLGVLWEDVIAAHCVHLSEKDIAILSKRNVKISHNPVSNLKLASGISPIPKLLKAGVTVSLGTDSPSSNNVADMFETMKLAALLHKGINSNPTVLPAETVLRMGTIEGARALRWENHIGSLDVGKKADIVIIDFDKPHLCPVYNVASHLVYAVRGADVETVIVNGNIVLENREIKTVNVEKVMEKVMKVKEALLDRLSSNP
jgi:5-methylthioadenosine/S-adenosylhomocysteine deaminase